MNWHFRSCQFRISFDLHNAPASVTPISDFIRFSWTFANIWKNEIFLFPSIYRFQRNIIFQMLTFFFNMQKINIRGFIHAKYFHGFLLFQKAVFNEIFHFRSIKFFCSHTNALLNDLNENLTHFALINCCNKYSDFPTNFTIKHSVQRKKKKNSSNILHGCNKRLQTNFFSLHNLPLWKLPGYPYVSHNPSWTIL